MGSLADLSDIVNRLTGGNNGTPEHLFGFIDGRVGAAAAAATVAGRWTSLWQYNKSPGGSGGAPAAAAIPVNDTTGAAFQTDPGGGRQKWMLGGSVGANSNGILMLYDRLAHAGGLSGTTTTAQTTNLPTGALSRYGSTASVGNMIFVEITTQIGTSATTATVDYKDQSGNLSTSKSFAIGGTGLREAQRMIPVPLADGDTGVTTIENLDLLATTSTAGDIALVLARPLATFPIANVGGGCVRDFIAGLPEIKEILTDACLAWAWLANGTTIPSINYDLHFIEA